MQTPLRFLRIVPARRPDERRERDRFNDAAAWTLLESLSRVPIGVGICDGDLRFVAVNSELASVHGFSAQAHYDTPARVHPRLPPGIVHSLRRVLKGGEPILNLEIGKLPGKANETPTRECLASFYPVVRRGGDEILGVMLVEVMQAALLQPVLDALPQGVLLLSPEGRIRLANTAAEQILGASHGQLGGRCYGNQGWRSDDKSGRPAESIVAQVVRSGKALFDIEQCLVGPDGTRRFVVQSAAPLRDSNGAVYELIVSLRDVTPQEKQAKEIRSSLEFHEQVIGIVGHDLRNPLAAILGSAGLLEKLADTDGLRSPLGARTLARIVHSAKRMERLIRDLLDYTRLRAGKGLPVFLAPANLHDICRDAAEEVTSANPGWKVHLDLEGDGAGLWDADRIEQIVSNLIGNAVQHGQRGTPVDLSVHPLADGRLSIEVRNQGEPIPGRSIPHLFEAFRRGNPGPSERRGVGLGLYIVAQITAAHGGSVTARSTTDGTVFQVLLPRRAQA